LRRSAALAGAGVELVGAVGFMAVPVVVRRLSPVNGDLPPVLLLAQWDHGNSLDLIF